MRRVAVLLSVTAVAENKTHLLTHCSVGQKPGWAWLGFCWESHANQGVSQSRVLIWRLWQRTHFQVHAGCGQNSVPCHCRTPGSMCPWWLLVRDCSASWLCLYSLPHDPPYLEDNNVVSDILNCSEFWYQSGKLSLQRTHVIRQICLLPYSIIMRGITHHMYMFHVHLKR